MYGHQRAKTGFTLIELLVAIGLFTVIMTVSAGAYLTVVRLNTFAQSTALTVDNLSYVVENMTRTIRTGSNYSCGGCPANGGTSSTFTFDDASGREITFSLETPDGENGHILETDPEGSFPLTDPMINITALTFVLSGAQPLSGGNADTQQAFVRMIVRGSIQNSNGQSVEFALQTAAAMRSLDL